MLDLSNAFPGKQDTEAVFIFVRPYFLAFLPTAFIFLFIFLASLLFQVGIVRNWFLPLGSDAANATLLFVGLFQLLTLTVFLIAVLDFYFDILVVTDRRLVDIDQEQLFFRRISELNLEEVEDVSSAVSGFFQSTFNYGTVLIQTAGSRENFEMVNFRFPREIAAIISDLSSQAKARIPEAQRIAESTIIGVIDDNTIQTVADLKQAGAIRADDPRIEHINPPPSIPNVPAG